MRVLAVDWSGALRAPERSIRVAEATASGPGRAVLRSVRGGLDRAGVVEHVLAVAATGPLVAGLDFSFALPAWFARERGCGDVADLWALVARDGEAWLADERPPFWGRTTPRPPLDPARPGWRRTERRARDAGRSPKSTFQIGGAGAVGTGSVRGMPHLTRLREAGVAVWPFDDAGAATVVEVYPTMFSGRARRSADARREAAGADDRIPPTLVPDVVATQDAFDAALTALAMAERVGELGTLRAAPPGSAEAIEGALWSPGE